LDADILIFTIVKSYICLAVTISLHLWPCADTTQATSGEQRPTIYLFKIACFVNNNAPPAIRAPVRDVSNILKTISQWRHATSLHIILANKCTNDTTRGRRPTQIAGTSRAIRRPYRLAFRPPTPLSDARDNGVSANHLIGRGDAAWTAIGDDTPPRRRPAWCRSL